MLKKTATETTPLTNATTDNGKLTISSNVVSLVAHPPEIVLIPGSYRYGLELTFPDGTVKTPVIASLVAAEDITL